MDIVATNENISGGPKTAGRKSFQLYLLFLFSTRFMTSEVTVGGEGLIFAFILVVLPLAQAVNSCFCCNYRKKRNLLRQAKLQTP